MNTYFLFLIRRDPVLQLTAHLAAGIAALLFITSFAAPKETHVNPLAHSTLTVSAVAIATPGHR